MGIQALSQLHNGGARICPWGDQPMPMTRMRFWRPRYRLSNLLVIHWLKCWFCISGTGLDSRLDSQKYPEILLVQPVKEGMESAHADHCEFLPFGRCWWFAEEQREEEMKVRLNKAAHSWSLMTAIHHLRFGFHCFQSSKALKLKTCHVVFN